MLFFRKRHREIDKHGRPRTESSRYAVDQLQEIMGVCLEKMSEESRTTIVDMFNELSSEHKLSPSGMAIILCMISALRLGFVHALIVDEQGIDPDPRVKDYIRRAIEHARNCLLQEDDPLLIALINGILEDLYEILLTRLI